MTPAELKHAIAQITHLTPARQAELFYTVTITGSDHIAVIITPTLSLLTHARIGHQDVDNLWCSAVLHVGMAVGNITEWLDQMDLRYTVTATWGTQSEPNWVEVLIHA